MSFGSDRIVSFVREYMRSNFQRSVEWTIFKISEPDRRSMVGVTPSQLENWNGEVERVFDLAIREAVAEIEKLERSGLSEVELNRQSEAVLIVASELGLTALRQRRRQLYPSIATNWEQTTRWAALYSFGAESAFQLLDFRALKLTEDQRKALRVIDGRYFDQLAQLRQGAPDPLDAGSALFVAKERPHHVSFYNEIRQTLTSLQRARLEGLMGTQRFFTTFL